MIRDALYLYLIKGFVMCIVYTTYSFPQTHSLRVLHRDSLAENSESGGKPRFKSEINQNI